MSKSGRIKSDLDDMTSLVEIIQILKDVASNSFYGAAKRKAKFEEFALAFTEFFRMVSLSEAVSPLVKNDIDKVAILAITWEGGFMADLNAKVIKTALGEGEKMNVVEYLVLGQKGAEKLATLTDKPIFVVENVVELGAYKAALAIKDRVIERVLKGEVGTFYVVYPRAKSLQFIKPNIQKLLPSEELGSKQMEIKDTIEKVIVESNYDDIINYLADLWITCRIDEMIEDCSIAAFAAQSQQLESSLERMKKDQKGLVMSFRKAKKSDIDKSLREVFTSKIMGGGRR